MKPTAKVPKTSLILNCLTRMLFLPMLSPNRSYHLSCPNRWYDVAGADDIQGASKTSSRVGPWYGCRVLLWQLFVLVLAGSRHTA
jgi:hypothetical protein